MKQRLALILALAFLLIPAGCGTQTAAFGKTSETIPELLDQKEYVLYQNVFYNQYGKQIEGTEVTKHGVFAVLLDAYNQRTRYYVWGYMDNTKCCDWQWEFVPDDLSALPPAGSLVSVHGRFQASGDALDGYWIEKASLQTETVYTGESAEVNMRAMSCTLERVQMLNILAKPDRFQGMTFLAYGRIAGPDKLEDPYYNGSWQIGFSSAASSPATGTQVVLRGTIGRASLTDCTITITK